MAGKKDKNKGGKGPAKKGARGISRDDAELWRAVTGDVERLPGRDYVEGEDEIVITPVVRERVSLSTLEKKPREVRPSPGQDEVDRRTAQKLKRGQMKIDGRVDLHGLGQMEAREVLARFLKSAAGRGKRCVLVITGKGGVDGSLGKPGVLKRKVPEWLREDPLATLVLRIETARPQDGGDGALYVLLRRQRES